MKSKGTNHRIGRRGFFSSNRSQTRDVGPEVRPVTRDAPKPLPSPGDWKRYFER